LGKQREPQLPTWPFDPLNTLCTSKETLNKGSLKHPVLIGRFIDYCFVHVPMLNDLTVLESEDVDDCEARCSRYPYGVYVQDHEIAIYKNPFDLAVRFWVFIFQKGDEVPQPFCAVGCILIVLNIPRPEVLRGFPEILPVDRIFIECKDNLLVLHPWGCSCRSWMEEESECQSNNVKPESCFHDCSFPSAFFPALIIPLCGRDLRKTQLQNSEDSSIVSSNIPINMKPRILFINPWIHDFAAFNLWARPLGLLKAAEYISAFDAEVLFIDCVDSFHPDQYGVGKYRYEIIQKPGILNNVPRYFKQYGVSAEEFATRLKLVMPFDIVLMTSIMSYWYTGVQETIRLVRQAAGDVPIILGGIYPTLYTDHASRHSGADSLYVGPLNDRLLSLVQAFGITLSAVRKQAPHYNLNLHAQHSFAPLLTSTGCPFYCSYCASRLLAPRYEQRPLDDVAGAIQELRARGIRDFVFYDDALLYDADHHIKPLLASLINRRFDVRLHAPNGLHARFIDDELARLMKRAGFTTIRLGLETIESGRQQATGGKVTNDDFERSVRSLQRAGFTKAHMGAYLLYGLPGQGIREVEAGIAFLKKLDVRIQLAEFSPIRGTGCWDDLVKNDIIPRDLDPLLTNNTVFSYLYSGYDQAELNRIKIDVKEFNRG